MVTFDINGAIVEFDEKTDNYNSIRKSFKNQAEYARDNFKNYCLNNILTLKDLSEKSLEIGMYNIESTIKKGVETLVGYNLITIDINTFKECYCEKYLNYQRMFNNTIKQTKTKSKILKIKLTIRLTKLKRKTLKTKKLTKLQNKGTAIQSIKLGLILEYLNN